MQINNNNFEEEVIKHKGIVLVDFYADWCGPCMMLKTTLNEIEEKYKDIKICKVNVDNNPELAMKFGVMSIPSVFFFKDGKQVEKWIGGRSKDDLRALINAAIK